MMTYPGHLVYTVQLNTWKLASGVEAINTYGLPHQYEAEDASMLSVMINAKE